MKGSRLLYNFINQDLEPNSQIGGILLHNQRLHIVTTTVFKVPINSDKFLLALSPNALFPVIGMF